MKTRVFHWPRLIAVAVVLLLACCEALAQPAIIQEKFYGSLQYATSLATSLQLAPGRYVHLCFQDGLPPTYTGASMYCLFTDAAGDSIGQSTPTSAFLNPLPVVKPVANPDGSFVGHGISISAGGSGDNPITKVDSLGNVVWTRNVNVGLAGVWGQTVRTPTGYWHTLSRWGNAQMVYEQAQLLITDPTGRTRSDQTFDNYTTGKTLTLLPDGSYLLISLDPNRLGGVLNYWSHSSHLRRFNAYGYPLSDEWVGNVRDFEETHDTKVCADGGLVLAGSYCKQTPPGQPRILSGQLIKLDAARQVEWKVTVVPDEGAFDEGCTFNDVQPLTNGHYLVCGQRRYTLPPPTRRGDFAYAAEIAPPLDPTDTVGRIVWEWRAPNRYSTFRSVLAQPDGSALFTGDYTPTTRRQAIYIVRMTGLAPPYVPNYCTTGPAAPTATTTGPVASTFTFRADSTTFAGPGLAQLSLCTWDWGDGSPQDTGWVQQHRYATPDPVRVRQCVVNNLFCATCTDHFPLGPLSAADELAAPVSVFPNPSATGLFTLRTGSGGPETRATFTVFDAVGRGVAAGALVGPEATLDLRAQPAGVYALRLTWADGRAVTKRLVRW